MKQLQRRQEFRETKKERNRKLEKWVFLQTPKREKNKQRNKKKKGSLI